MKRRIILSVLAASALAACVSAAPEPEGLAGVTRPCSLRKVCEELSRRCHAPVLVEPALAEQRVVWSFGALRPVEETMQRLAELTGGQVTAGDLGGGRRRYTLLRGRRTPALVASWRHDALARSIAELLRAAEADAQGKLDLSGMTANARIYLAHGSHNLRYLRALNAQQIDMLLAGSEVRFPPGSIPDEQIRETMERMFPLEDFEDPPDARQRLRDRGFNSALRDGMSLRLEETQDGALYHLSLHLGRFGATGLTRFGDEEFGLPLTHVNPYRWLEKGDRAGPSPDIPEALRKPLAEDLVLPEGGRAEDALRLLARLSGFDVVSDAYLTRPVPVHRGTQRVVLAPKGTAAAAAFDELCVRYHTIWWEKGGCAYVKARAWPWDQEFEPPDGFIDTWTGGLSAGRPLGPDPVKAMAGLSSRQFDGLASLDGHFDERRMPHLYRDSLREFAGIFAKSSRAAQLRLLGAGLPMSQDQASTMLLEPFRSDVRDGPVLLRLAQKISPSVAPAPPGWTVTLSLVRHWPGETSQMDLPLVFPRLTSPFE